MNSKKVCASLISNEVKVCSCNGEDTTETESLSEIEKSSRNVVDSTTEDELPKKKLRWTDGESDVEILEVDDKATDRSVEIIRYVRSTKLTSDVPSTSVDSDSQDTEEDIRVIEVVKRNTSVPMSMLQIDERSGTFLIFRMKLL